MAGSGRKLDFFERWQSAVHEVTGSNVVTNVMLVEPPVDKGALTKAANKLQAYHPLLQATMRKEGGEAYFEPDSARLPEVREYTKGSVEMVADREVHERLRPEECCFRLALRGAHILLTYHHGFLDGASAMAMVQDLMLLLDGGELPLEEKADALLPSVLKDLPKFKFKPGALLDSKRDSWPADPWWPEPNRVVRWDQRRTRFIMHKLSVNESSRLLDRCRAEGTTVLGALGAALIRAASAVLGGTPAMDIHTVVNIRPHCRRPARSLGHCIGGVTSMLVADLPFWELARKYKADVTELIDGHHVFSMVCAEERSYETCVVGQHFALRKEKSGGTNQALFISNRGASKLSTELRRVKSLHFIRQESGGGSGGMHYFALNAACVDGVQCLTLQYVDPICAKAVGAAVASALLRDLLGAADEQGPLTLAGLAVRQVWVVVGGGDKGGIVARAGEGLRSQELARLATGAKIRELARVGERLKFEKMEGEGPESGWVSLRHKDNDLLHPVPMEE